MLPTIEFTKDMIFVPREKISEEEKWIKHVHCDGARFHVLSYFGMYDGTTKVHCSEPDCIYNKDE